MSVRIIRTSVMKMQLVEILMEIILVSAMMGSWVMVSLVQVCEFIIVAKPYQFQIKYFLHLINYYIPEDIDRTLCPHYVKHCFLRHQ